MKNVKTVSKPVSKKPVSVKYLKCAPSKKFCQRIISEPGELIVRGKK